MGRKKKEQKVMTKEDAKRINAEMDARLAVRDREKFLLPFSEGRKFNRAEVVAEIRVFANHAVLGAIEAGKRLFWAKQEIPHGEWEKFLREEVGIPERTAQEWMLIARRAAKSAPGALLGNKRPALLAEVNDEELKEIEESGKLYGKDLDEASAMTYRELREFKEKHRDRENTWKKNLEKEKAEKLQLQNELFGQKIGLGEEEEAELAKLNGVKAAFNNIWYRMDTADLSKASDRMLTEFLILCEYMHDLSKLLFLRKDNQYNRMESQRSTPAEVKDQEGKVIRKYPQVYAGKTGGHGGPPLQDESTSGEGMPS